MGKRKSKRLGVEKRRLEKKLRALQDGRKTLAALEPGGSPERSLAADSAATVEIRAKGLGCMHCSGNTQVVEHDALTVEGRRLRRLKLLCKGCDAERIVWIQISQKRLD